MPNVHQLLESRVAAAIEAAYPDAADAPPLVAEAQDPRFGDYQANAAMGLAKRLGAKPRDVAAAIVERLQVSDLCETPEIAGPGFINLRLQGDWLAATLGKVHADPRLGMPEPAEPERVVVDYSAPNLAKEMHVGHLRSTIIGDALVRMLDFAGHEVIRQNHVGDWGTQFGMLVAYLKETLREDPEGLKAERQLADLEGFYKAAKRRFDADEAFANAAREEVVGLQRGDEATLEMWHRFREISLRHCRDAYARLGVLLTDDDVRGESAYNDDLPEVVDALREQGLLEESEGAQCVFLPGFVSKEGDRLPLIVQKSDEGYLYATTDLAAIRYRVGELRAKRVLYVVDARQSLHFRQVFATARAAGFAPEEVELVHVAFGTMMGEDGKPFKTREGGTVKLAELLDEAERRALALVREKNPDLAPEEQADIARIVGIGAVKYADLARNRTSDYAFSWEKMLSLQGNTAPYMQYAYARIRSIFRKGDHDPAAARADASSVPLAAPEEQALAKALLRLPETVDRALGDDLSHVVAAWLYDLAGAFTRFYEACPVLQSEGEVRAARLKLCDLTARAVAKGLDLLGIETAERM